MKNWKVVAVSACIVGVIAMSGFTRRVSDSGAVGKQQLTNKKALRPYPKGCVFRTLMGEESSEDFGKYKTPERVMTSLDRGLVWMAKAQNKNGGWGAGSHSRQDITDPHAVNTDPATTSMVAMALLRTGSTTTGGPYRNELNKAIEYLLRSVETSAPQSFNITDQVGTQIQSKLGQNIDVILTSQFLSNLLDKLDDGAPLKDRVKKANAVCVSKIQKAQGSDGVTAGSGWAGVLQSSFAANALEAAERNDIAVDKQALQKAKNFQIGNYDAKSGEAKTDLGAGVVLY